MLMAHCGTLSVISTKVTEDKWGCNGESYQGLLNNPPMVTRDVLQDDMANTSDYNRQASRNWHPLRELRARGTGNCVWVVLRVDPGQDVPFTSQTSTGQKGNSRSPAIHQTPAHKQVLSPTHSHTRSHTQSLNSSYWYTELLCLQALLSLGLACTQLIPPIYKRAPKYTQRLIKVGHPLLKRIPVLWDEKVISPSTP